MKSIDVMKTVEVKHLVEMLRISYNAVTHTAESMGSDTYARGMKAGMELATRSYLEYLERLEKVIAESQGYMVEDVDLSGSEKIGEVI